MTFFVWFIQSVTRRWVSLIFPWIILCVFLFISGSGSLSGWLSSRRSLFLGRFFIWAVWPVVWGTIEATRTLFIGFFNVWSGWERTYCRETSLRLVWGQRWRIRNWEYKKSLEYNFINWSKLLTPLSMNLLYCKEINLSKT